MFGKIAAFEFRYQLRQPVFWVAVFFFALFNFALVASDNVSLGAGGNVKENAIIQDNLILNFRGQGLFLAGDDGAKDYVVVNNAWFHKLADDGYAANSTTASQMACTAVTAAASGLCSPMRRATVAVTAIARPIAIA